MASDIAAAATAYIEAFQDGDGERLAAILLPDCRIASATDGTLALTSAAAFIDKVAARPPDPALRRLARLIAVDRWSERAGSALVEVARDRWLFREQLQLVRIDDQWRMIGKVYHWIERGRPAMSDGPGGKMGDGGTAVGGAAILFEPVRIGPVTAPNRFYQTPHGCGFGHREPAAMVEIRRIKAEGGWGVVSTEQAEIHPTSDMMPITELRLWDDRDVPVLAAIAEAIHAHGALAAIEPSHSGANTANRGSREAPMAPSPIPLVPSYPSYPLPWQARGMSLQDIRDFRDWHRAAVRRALSAGFDIVYVYASLVLGLPNQFLSPAFNRRGDHYGGPLRNRARLLMELIEDTRELVDGRAALAVRLTLDELLGLEGGRRPALEELFGLVGELPDLWDVVLGGMGEAAGSARFDVDAGRDAAIVAELRRLTSRKLLCVGLFNGWQDMVALVRDGVVDLIGAARQSIADPFLPAKLKAGRPDAIRTCIRCNICVSHDFNGVGVACTQNPTFGEEWRRGWHPERLPPAAAPARVAVVGAGPAGLECAAVLGGRGHAVDLFEAAAAPGGHVRQAALLPRLGLLAEVVEHRLARLARLPGVSLRLGERAEAAALLAGGYRHVVLATGARWSRTGGGRPGVPAPALGIGAVVLTPDDILEGVEPPRRLLVYDDDHYYMGGALAELLQARGCQVTLATPAAEASIWTHNTMEQRFIQRQLLRHGVDIVPHRRLVAVESDHARLACVFTGAPSLVAADAVLLVAHRDSVATLQDALADRRETWAAAGLGSVQVIGDARAPGLLMHAVRDGHRLGRELGAPPGPEALRREIPLP